MSTPSSRVELGVNNYSSHLPISQCPIKMFISLERSGGFTGIGKLIKIDTTKIPQHQAEQLPILLESANFFNLPAYIAPDSTLNRDRFQYTITVEDKNKQHTVTVGESSIPGHLRPLIDWINCK
ncbi:MAG: protealysin inhibitor emfourin [Nostocales cyanobacterium 94392]|nr:protealysin inhibitor emfourin [Nostocales cyanobacterium 94392]